jgi:hypothetical protein
MSNPIAGVTVEVLQAFADAWNRNDAEALMTFADAHWGNARHFVQGDRGVSQWTFTGTRADGTRVEVHGCDLFTFTGRKDRLEGLLPKESLASATLAAHPGDGRAASSRSIANRSVTPGSQPCCESRVVICPR